MKCSFHMRLDDILDAVHEDQEKCGGENPALWDAILEVYLPAFFSLKAHSPSSLAEIFFYPLQHIVGHSCLHQLENKTFFPYFVEGLNQYPPKQWLYGPVFGIHLQWSGQCKQSGLKWNGIDKILLVRPLGFLFFISPPDSTRKVRGTTGSIGLAPTRHWAQHTALLAGFHEQCTAYVIHILV